MPLRRTAIVMVVALPTSALAARVTYGTFLPETVSAASVNGIPVSYSAASAPNGDTVIVGTRERSYLQPDGVWSRTWDAFVARISPGVRTMNVVRTVPNTIATALTIDPAGFIYMAAAGFGADPSAGLVVKLAPDNSVVYQLQVSARPTAIAVDGAGAAYVTGTAGAGLRATASALIGPNPCVSAGCALLLRVDANGAATSTTLIGGSGPDTGTAIAIGPGGAVYIVGETRSADFPVTTAAYQRRYGGTETSSPAFQGDGFVVRLDTTGRTLISGTYLGGALADTAAGVAVDALGSVHVIGTTRSADFPVTAGAPQSKYGGCDPWVPVGGDTFVVRS